MVLKKFDEFSNRFSSDPAFWKNKIILASKNNESDLFETVNSDSSSVLQNSAKPVILWDEFKVPTNTVNETFEKFYNANSPIDFEIDELFKDSEFIPNFSNNRKDVKHMKFPIKAISKDTSELFKTYGKFKKSESNFSKFKSIPKVDNRFEVLCFKDSPIHIQEKVNGVGFDVSRSSFNKFNSVLHIAEEVSKKVNLDFYQLNLIESDGTFYLDEITKSSKLTPAQLFKMYETAYYHFYETRLPQWFKKSIFENSIVPYYKTKIYDAKLLKPKYSIDFEKFI